MLKRNSSLLISPAGMVPLYAINCAPPSSTFHIITRHPASHSPDMNLSLRMSTTKCSPNSLTLFQMWSSDVPKNNTSQGVIVSSVKPA
ncbi:hypothetical protein CEXT_501261 [Caerostris extrusa]|uniref:Uncharacterized protein n=1 Tax=Caerostris extrusa TaxID=172846 RepID=A0AAV4RYF7_CAEEX|nr:hypothetical protein CEXT_501261 [Caerostris extrusa]